MISGAASDENVVGNIFPFQLFSAPERCHIGIMTSQVTVKLFVQQLVQADSHENIMLRL